MPAADPSDPQDEPPLPEDFREWMRVVNSPPRWFTISQNVLWLLLSLVLALIVMVQWAMLFILTIWIYEPWSVIIGISIACAQMLMLFDEVRDDKACSLNHQPHKNP